MAEAPARYTATGKLIRRTLLGRKIGMTQIFDETGNWVPVTALEVGPCTILQVKTPEKDGYAAVQLGFGKRKKVRRPQAALYAKLGVEPHRWVREVPVVAVSTPPGPPEGAAASTPPGPPEGAAASSSAGAPEAAGAASLAEVRPGARVGLELLAGVKRVDVRGISKGRGFAGVIRRHHFSAGPKSHGTKNIREPGSTGMHTDPGRVLKGKRMPGHLGAVPAKARNLEVVRLEPEANLLLVRGAVPGPNGGMVTVEESLRQR